MSNKCFSTLEIDAIGEILNISLGASATAVSTMLNARVDITTPIVNVVSKEEFKLERVEPAVGVEITYVTGLEGKNVMLLKRHDVKVIVEMLMGMSMSDEEFELNEINISAVCEVMNQMMGASATALSEFFGKMVNISTPVSFEVGDEKEFLDQYFEEDVPQVVVGFTLKIADKLESEFFNLMPVALAKSLVVNFLPPDAIMDENGEMPQPAESAEPIAAAQVAEPAAEPAAEASSGKSLSQDEIEKLLAGGAAEEPVASASAEPAPAPSGKSLSQDEIEKLLAGGAAEEPAAPVSAPASPVPSQAPPVAPAAPVAAPAMAAPQMSPDASMMQMQMMQQMMQQMQQMQQQMMEVKSKPPAEPKVINVQPDVRPNLRQDSEIVLQEEQEENMELIMGVPLEISVEIGRTKKLVKDILDFTKGSLVVLDKLAGEQVDLLVNGRCIAKGDVVVIEDNFGIRITEIMKINITALE